jgi:hypothetical protein
VGHGIEKAPDVRVKHPVHSFPENADVQGVQRIVLTASRSEPIGKTDEVLLVDDGDVMQQCGEPHTLALSRRSAHAGKPDRRGIPAQCPGRGGLAAVPLGRGPFLHGLR